MTKSKKIVEEIASEPIETVDVPEDPISSESEVSEVEEELEVPVVPKKPRKNAAKKGKAVDPEQKRNNILKGRQEAGKTKSAQLQTIKAKAFLMDLYLKGELDADTVHKHGFKYDIKKKDTQIVYVPEPKDEPKKPRVSIRQMWEM